MGWVGCSGRENDVIEGRGCNHCYVLTCEATALAGKLMLPPSNLVLLGLSVPFPPPPALEDLREEHEAAVAVAAANHTEAIKKERYEHELAEATKDDGEMEKEVEATAAIAELRAMVDGLQGQLSLKANEIAEGLEQQLQQAKRFEEDTVTLMDDNRRYQKQLVELKVQLLA